jgi:hypothetical protein
MRRALACTGAVRKIMMTVLLQTLGALAVLASIAAKVAWLRDEHALRR